MHHSSHTQSVIWNLTLTSEAQAPQLAWCWISPFDLQLFWNLPFTRLLPVEKIGIPFTTPSFSSCTWQNLLHQASPFWLTKQLSPCHEGAWAARLPGPGTSGTRDPAQGQRWTRDPGPGLPRPLPCVGHCCELIGQLPVTAAAGCRRGRPTVH